MNLISSLRRDARGARALDAPPVTFDDWVSLNFNGLNYPMLRQTLLGGKQAEIPPNFQGFTEYAYKTNGIVFACVVARLLLFSEARMKFRPLSSSVNSTDLFGAKSLSLLEEPWPGATTGDLLSRMILNADLGGNGYAVRLAPDRITCPRPDWMTVVAGSRRENGLVGDLDMELLGYIYRPNGTGDPQVLHVEDVAHFAPLPDPTFPFRGMSWLSPVIEEIMADGASTTHKRKFFENGATPNMVVTLGDIPNEDEFYRWVDAFEEGHAGTLNAYKTLYLANGSDAKVVGTNMQQLDFKVTQAHGETRICNAARIPPIIVGVSEGLDSATYSNYGQARRAFADGTMRPLWRGIAGVLAKLIDIPSGAELWYDDRDIAFLQEDQKDAAEIQQVRAATIKSLIDAGFRPASVIAAVSSGDFSKLEHTGLYSVQLQPPGTNFTPTKGNDAPPPGRGANGANGHHPSLLEQLLGHAH